MKKVIFVLSLLFSFVLLFSACDENKPNTPEIPTAEHTHTLGDWVTDKAATCTEDGQRHQICSTCGETIKAEVIPAGHTEVIDPAVAPTCTKTGLTEGKHCSVCDEVLVAQQVVPATRHQFVNHVCTVCGEKEYSKGLAFTSNGNGTCYVRGIGTCTDTDIAIPPVSPNGDRVTIIGYEAFYKCTSLTSVTIPDNVTSIGWGAFSYCTSLTSVTIPDSVTSIGGKVFSYCTSLTSVTIPDSVTSIGEFAFEGCTNLIEVCNLSILNITAGSSSNGYVGYYAKHIYKEGESYLHTTADGYIFYENGNKVYLMGHIGNATELALPEKYNGKTYGIYQYAFYYCTSLTSVTIGNSVTSIGEYAFRDCTSLTSVYITDVAKWCAISFGNYEANPLYYAYNLYLNGKLVTDLVIPDGVTSIGRYAFRGCTSLTSVTIPDSVTSIGSEAFSDCTSLTSVTIPDSVTSIGVYAFYNCTSLTSVYITDVAKWCAISFGDYEANPLYYAHNLYLNGKLVTDLVIPDGVTSIGEYAFRNCHKLTSVTIGNSVTSIGSEAFSDCTSLTSVTIPDSVTSIGVYAFYNCTSLQYNVYNNAKYLGNANNPYVALIKVSDTSINSCNIHSNTKVIADSAFYNCTSLTSVTIPDSVTSIGRFAFYYCTSLTSVTIGNSVTSIGSDAFYNCTSLTSVTFANTSGWYRTTTVGASSGTNMTVTNPSTNATNLRSSYRDYYWYRK